MNSQEKPENEAPKKRRPQKRRIIKIMKWSLIVLALIFVANWITSAVVASRNQKKINHFFQEIGADSLEQLAGAEGDKDLFCGNGWYLYLGALASLSRETLDIEDDDAPDGNEISNERRAFRERELDRVHGILEEAEKAPYTVAVYNYNDPFSIEQPHCLEAYDYARLAVDSVRYLVRQGEPLKAGERLLDAVAMARGTTKFPVLITAMMRQSTLEKIADELSQVIQELPDAILERLKSTLESFDLEKDFATGLRGEVFYALFGWELLQGTRTISTSDEEDSPGIVIPSWPLRYLIGSILELDKAAYLDLMLPVATDPTLENAQRVTRDSIPFYAKITGVLAVPRLEGAISKHERIQAHLAVVLEALRLELGRRHDGEWPAPRADCAGIPLEVKATPDGLVITSPVLRKHLKDSEEVFTVQLR